MLQEFNIWFIEPFNINSVEHLRSDGEGNGDSGIKTEDIVFNLE
jgi:hypothetical protein